MPGRKFSSLLLLQTLLLSSVSSSAQNVQTTNGCAAISDPANTSFHDRDLYVYVYDLNGVALAHGNNPKMVGKPLIGLKDNEGKPMIKEMVDLAKTKGSGWVDFKWPNPVTKAVESKSGYVEKVDEMLVGSGILNRCE